MFENNKKRMQLTECKDTGMSDKEQTLNEGNSRIQNIQIAPNRCTETECIEKESDVGMENIPLEPFCDTTDDPCDKGYAWIILFSCCLIYAIVPGAVKSFGVLYAALLDFYDEGAGNIAWIPGLVLFLYFGLGPISNFLCIRFTFRMIMTIGSCVMLLGFTASAFVPKMEFLYLTYGLVVGTGYGLIFSPCSTIIPYYFNKSKGLALGLMAASSGVGNVVIPYMYGYLIEIYGLPGTLLISGAIFFHVAALSLTLRQPKIFEKLVKNRRQESEKHRSVGVFETMRDIFNFNLCKNSKYTIYLLASCFQAANAVSSKVVLPGAIRTLGFDKEIIVVSVSVFGPSEIIGRLFMGWLSDKAIISNIKIIMICSGISAMSAFCMPYLPYTSAMIAYAVVIGAFSGAIWGLNTYIVLDYVGKNSLPAAIGLLNMFWGVSICISQPIAGWLEDATGSWTMSFFFLGTLSVLAVLLCILESHFEKCCYHKTEATNSNLFKESISKDRQNDQPEEHILLPDNSVSYVVAAEDSGNSECIK